MDQIYLLSWVELGKLNDINDFFKSHHNCSSIINHEVGRNTLNHAIITGQIDIVKLFIQFGSDLNSKDKYDRNYLYVAVNNNKYDITKLLLEHGAEVTAPISYGNIGRVLHVACYNGNIELITLLLKFGANVKIQVADKYVNKYDNICSPLL